MKNIINPIFTK